jgi:hypothetical protein
MRKITVEEVIYEFPKKSSHKQYRHCEGVRWRAAGAVLGLFGAFVFPLLTPLVVPHLAAPFTANSFVQKLPTISTEAVETVNDSALRSCH